MTAYVASRNTITKTGAFGMPCEGPMTVKVEVDFTIEENNRVDLSDVQASGLFSSLQTIFCDNRENDNPVFFDFDVSRQTFAVPPGGFIYMPALQPNPPKFSVSSIGQFVIPIHCMNYFMPPVIWGPDAPPGGGGGSGGITAGEVTDLSGTIAVGGTPQTLAAASAFRRYLLVNNPLTATSEVLQIRFNGGGWIDILNGGAYETGGFCPTDLVEIVAATTGHAFTAYSHP